MARSPLKPLPPLHREPRSPATLEQLALAAVPNPGETARQFLPPWHSVRRELEKQEYYAMREEFRKEHAKKFRCHARIKVCQQFELDMEFVSQPHGDAVTTERFCCVIERR